MTKTRKVYKTHKYVFRSTVTGKMVSRAYAEAHQGTTIQQRVQLRNRRKNDG